MIFLLKILIYLLFYKKQRLIQTTREITDVNKNTKRKLLLVGFIMAVIAVTAAGSMIEKQEGTPFRVEPMETATVIKDEATPMPQIVENKININTADAELLKTLNGIGDVMAQRIIDYRVENDGFKSVEDIKNISGIGNKTFNNIKNQICVE